MRNDLKNISSKSTLFLGIDLEGMNQNLPNGVNVQYDRVIEIGAVLWDCNQAQPVKILSEIVDESDRLTISEEVYEITGLSESIVSTWGAKKEEIKEILLKLKSLIEKSDYIIAHNGSNYDFVMLKAMFDRFHLTMPEKIWIDSIRDIEFPKNKKNVSLRT